MGPLACFLSAVFFGVMAIFAKLAYAAGVDVHTLLIVRFGMAGAALCLVAAAIGAFRGMSRRTAVAAFLMGALGYAPQAGLYFLALTHTGAATVALGFSTYPLLVVALAVLTRRERATSRRLVAMGVAWVGVAMALGGGGGDVGLLGGLIALASAAMYACYIMVGDRVLGAASPVALTALVCAGAFTTLFLTSLPGGGPDLAFDPAGWLWLSLIALVCTVGAVLLFFAGLALTGPSITALIGLVEPVVTVLAAGLVLGESLGPVQVLGGVLVLGAVALVQVPTRDDVAPVAPEPEDEADVVPASSLGVTVPAG